MIDPIFQTDNYQLARKLLDASALRQEAIDSMFTPQFRASLEAAMDRIYTEPRPTTYTRRLRAIQGGRR